MVFIDFQNFENFRRKLADFRTKNAHFFLNQQKFRKFFFDGKWIKSVGNASIGLKTGQNVPWGIYYNLLEMFFWFFAFFQLYGWRNVQKWRFLAKYSDFYPKIALSAYFGSRKIVKKQNIKKSLHRIVENTLRYIFAHF